MMYFSVNPLSLPSFYLLLLQINLILGPPSLASAAAAAGKLNLYDDYNCNHQSTINPTVNLTLSTCLVTTGGEGLVIDELPPCPQGTASLLYYQDTGCGVPTNDVSKSMFASNCFQLAAGTDVYNAKSIMFSCSANNPQASSTTTAIVSALAAVATGSTGDNTGGSSNPTSTGTPNSNSNSGGGSGGSSSGTSAGSNPTGNTSPTSTSSSTNPTSNLNSGSGLNTSDIIAIAVGVGVGLPTMAIMLAAWLFPDFRHKIRSCWTGEGRRQKYPLPSSPPSNAGFSMHGSNNGSFALQQQQSPPPPRYMDVTPKAFPFYPQQQQQQHGSFRSY